MTLKEIRKNKKLTQKHAATYLGVSLRTYQSYETETTKQIGFKHEYMLEKLKRYGYIDETTGVLTIDDIKKTCLNVLSEYNVDYCYLFGSYAKGIATEQSDVDLYIFTETTGLKYFEMIETLRENLHKIIDVINQVQLQNNMNLVNEILRYGIKIYG